MFASRVTGNIEDCLEVGTAVFQKKKTKNKRKKKKKLIHYKYLMKNQKSKFSKITTNYRHAEYDLNGFCFTPIFNSREANALVKHCHQH